MWSLHQLVIVYLITVLENRSQGRYVNMRRCMNCLQYRHVKTPLGLPIWKVQEIYPVVSFCLSAIGSRKIAENPNSNGSCNLQSDLLVSVSSWVSSGDVLRYVPARVWAVSTRVLPGQTGTATVSHLSCRETVTTRSHQPETVYAGYIMLKTICITIGWS